LKRSIGLALVDSHYAAVGTSLSVDVRGALLQAAVAPTPFYKRLRYYSGGR
jgi:aminomethyltransferase